MKKIQKLIVITMALFMFNFANALEIIDVKANHWAGQSIIHSIQNGYISVIDGNKFQPEASMSRSEFVTSLLKVISRQNEAIVKKTTFKDINKNTPNNRNITLSEQIRMAFGYPDLTFKPENNITHNEVMAMIANITNNDYSAADITGFKDYNEIPVWATRAYIKNVANDIYVNHPDELMFTPSKDITRAEAAVLFDKLLLNINKVKEDFRNAYDGDDDALKNALSPEVIKQRGYDKSNFITTNTLDLVPFATNDKVQIYDNKKVIEAGNMLVLTNLKLVKTRKDLVGAGYVFQAPSDVYTKECTFLFPKGTEFYARVEKIGYSAWRSKPDRSTFVFTKYSLPSGETYDMAGVPFTKNENIVYVNSKKAKKTHVLTYNADNKNHLIKCAHQMSPLTEFNIKTAKTIYILITGDTIIPQNAQYLNLRTEKSLLEENI